MNAQNRRHIADHLDEMVRIATSEELDFDTRRRARWSIMMVALLLTDKEDPMYPGEMENEIRSAVRSIHGGVAPFEELH